MRNYCALNALDSVAPILVVRYPGTLVRTGLHHEEVYGPSLARMELAGVVDQATVQYQAWA